MSLDAGEFPAGAVLVSANGNVYESKPSIPHNHGEMMVIDRAVEKEGIPLMGAKIYASMEPCIMCLCKMYWAGVSDVEYAVAKADVRSDYAYESEQDPQKFSSGLHKPVSLIQNTENLEDALTVYRSWIQKIEG